MHSKQVAVANDECYVVAADCCKSCCYARGSGAWIDTDQNSAKKHLEWKYWDWIWLIWLNDFDESRQAVRWTGSNLFLLPSCGAMGVPARPKPIELSSIQSIWLTHIQRLRAPVRRAVQPAPCFRRSTASTADFFALEFGIWFINWYWLIMNNWFW